MIDHIFMGCQFIIQDIKCSQRNLMVLSLNTIMGKELGLMMVSNNKRYFLFYLE